MTKLLTLLGAAALASSLATAASAGPVTNGGFANLASTWTDNTGAGGNDAMKPGAVGIPGWTIINNNELWAAATNTFGLTASPGNSSGYFLDLTGLGNITPYGGVQQTISTQAGLSYILTFDLGASSPYNTGQYQSAAINASVTGTQLLASQLFTLAPVGTNNWVGESLLFTANSATSTIELLGNSSYHSLYIGLDNVAVNQVTGALPIPVPEPASWPLLLVGAGAAVVLARRKFAPRARA